MTCGLLRRDAYMSPPLLLWPASGTHILHQIGLGQLLYCWLSCNSRRATDRPSTSWSLRSLQCACSTFTKRVARQTGQSAAMHASTAVHGKGRGPCAGQRSDATGRLSISDICQCADAMYFGQCLCAFVATSIAIVCIW